MAVLEGGTSAVLAEVGAVAASPLHVTGKPAPFGSLGEYALGVQSGTMAAGMAANSDVFQARWTDSTRFALIWKVQIAGLYQLTAFTAGAARFRLGFARSWSADGTGGTALTLTGANNQLAASMGASLFGTIRMATTAALGAGTKTYDTQDNSDYSKMILAAANTQVIEPSDGILWDAADFRHPIRLAQNEGVTIRATVPATGTWVFSVRMIWSEVTAY